MSLIPTQPAPVFDCEICEDTGWVHVDDVARRCCCGTDQRRTARQVIEAAGIPLRFSAKGLEDWQTRGDAKREEIVAQLRDFVSAFDRSASHGLFLTGPCGTGKTTLAAATLRGVGMRGFRVKWWDTGKLMDEIKATFDPNSDETQSDILEAIDRCDLLVLDDLGAEYGTRFVLDRLYRIINGRYEELKSLIVVSNLSLGKLAANGDVETRANWVRISSRIAEMCPAVTFAGFEDHRLATAKGRDGK